MRDKDQKLIWESYEQADETVATQKNIDRAKMLLHDPDTEPDDREIILNTLRELERMATKEDLPTVRKKIMDRLSRLTNFHFGTVNEQPRPDYDALVKDQDHWTSIATGPYQDMDQSQLEQQLKALEMYSAMSPEQLNKHREVLEELVEMDELNRAQMQGHGPQFD